MISGCSAGVQTELINNERKRKAKGSGQCRGKSPRQFVAWRSLSPFCFGGFFCGLIFICKGKIIYLEGLGSNLRTRNASGVGKFNLRVSHLRRSSLDYQSCSGGSAPLRQMFPYSKEMFPTLLAQVNTLLTVVHKRFFYAATSHEYDV